MDRLERDYRPQPALRVPMGCESGVQRCRPLATRRSSGGQLLQRGAVIRSSMLDRRKLGHVRAGQLRCDGDRRVDKDQGAYELRFDACELPRYKAAVRMAEQDRIGPEVLQNRHEVTHVLLDGPRAFHRRSAVSA